LTLSEMIQQISRKRLSPVTLAESLLNRIDLREPSIQAWVTVDRGRSGRSPAVRRRSPESESAALFMEFRWESDIFIPPG
jgi:Asp-tRNA(Asn)/Glu-tRNA(Gln) amidotransferase A subunit family amidase